MKKLHPYILILSIVFPLFLQAQNQPKPDPVVTRILFIFDASQSMYGTWNSDKKINIARTYLIKMIDSLEQVKNVQMALRVYGHQSPVPPQDCNDTKLEVPFSVNNAPKIRQTLRYLIPKGTTPIAHSLELAVNDFPACENCRNVIILITDGIEACDGDPCQVSIELQKNGIILKPFIIGIGLDPNLEKSFDCVGQVFNSPNEEEFRKTLDIVITRALNTTTCQVNLLDIYGKPSETDVNMTFFDHISGKVKYNYVHTINHMGNPDTLIIDPLITYDLVVHTIPAVRKTEITLNQGKHNIIGLPSPQGQLQITSPGTNQYKGLNILIKKAGEKETIHIQENNSTEKYLVGNYDLEVLTIPRIYINNLEIQANTTTKVQIPKPGIASFSLSAPGFASLYSETTDTLIWIYNLDKKETRQNLIMQPGDYRIVYRAKNAKQSIYTINKRFTIKSGSSESIILY
ncbi:MAG TPA: VWA domain-containing protein [Bacteroidales bacterium]|mgnify:FL=1|nr:VWA domain-containing protein [Bacteroidales bacterium]